jgi:hypothetical protein
MKSDIQRLVVLHLAMFAFLFAISAQPGLIWRGHPPAVTVR